MPRISVVGSINLDMTVTAPALPRPGETVSGGTFERHPGGKGANQALAAKRMGASEVRMVACVGDDREATEATKLLRRDGVDLSACRVVETIATGVALIVVGPQGENQIVVAPGANQLLTADDVDVRRADAVVCQLEIPDPPLVAAVEQASLSIVNLAPARQVPVTMLEACTVVVVNETERAFYGSVLDSLSLVVVTLGAEGAVALARGEEVARAAAPKVEAIDTVGAGDTFVGALAVELASQRDIHDALLLAVWAGALATTRPGAQPSIPTRAEVLAAMEET